MNGSNVLEICWDLEGYGYKEGDIAVCCAKMVDNMLHAHSLYTHTHTHDLLVMTE